MTKVLLPSDKTSSLDLPARLILRWSNKGLRLRKNPSTFLSHMSELATQVSSPYRMTPASHQSLLLKMSHFQKLIKRM